MNTFLQKYKTVIGLVLLFTIVAAGGLIWYKQTQTEAIAITNINKDTNSTKAEEQNTGDQVVVDVEGAIINPGVYYLPLGSRVEDALQAAGGITEEADMDRFGLSRAAKVKDEQLIKVPKQGDIVEEAKVSAAGASGCVSINTASSSELDSLSGIGAARATKIIENRPYADTSELVSKKAVPQSVYDGIQNEICI